MMSSSSSILGNVCNNPTSQTTTDKKKPGRPPKKKVIEVNPSNVGIADAPRNPDNIMELTYDNPLLLRKLIALYKKYSIPELTFHFYKDRIELSLKNEKGCFRLFTTLHGNMMNRYYCAEPMTRTVKRESLDKIFKSKDKNYPEVTFILQREDSLSKLYIVMKTIQVGSNHQYEADLIPDPLTEPVIKTPIDEYDLSFELPSDYFKKLIADINADSKELSLKKEGPGPVDIGYSNTGKLNLAATYPDNEKIKLKTKLSRDDIFTVTVPLVYIKPLSDSNIGKEITITADRFLDFCITTHIDKRKYMRGNGEVEGYACDIQLFVVINHI